MDEMLKLVRDKLLRPEFSGMTAQERYTRLGGLMTGAALSHKLTKESSSEMAALILSLYCQLSGLATTPQGDRV